MVNFFVVSDDDFIIFCVLAGKIPQRDLDELFVLLMLTMTGFSEGVFVILALLLCLCGNDSGTARSFPPRAFSGG